MAATCQIVGLVQVYRFVTSPFILAKKGFSAGWGLCRILYFIMHNIFPMWNRSGLQAGQPSACTLTPKPYRCRVHIPVVCCPRPKLFETCCWHEKPIWAYISKNQVIKLMKDNLYCLCAAFIRNQKRKNRKSESEIINFCWISVLDLDIH